MLGGDRELGRQPLDDPVELGVHLDGVGLVEDRAQQREHPGLMPDAEIKLNAVRSHA